MNTHDNTNISKQITAGRGKMMQNLKNKETEVNKTQHDLVDKILRKVGAAKKTDSLIASIMQMTRYTLNASASSLLLMDEKNEELLFKFANGPVGKQLRRLQIKGQSGVAGWVSQYGKPLMVNDVDKDQRFNRYIDEFTGFTTKSIICAPLIVHRKVIGVIEVLNKLDGTGFNGQDLQTLIGVANITALAIENIRLNESLQDSYKRTVKALVSLVDDKETYGGGHSRRVSEYALMGATHLLLSEEEKQSIEYAAILHDIGKLSIPDSILNKSDTLTNEEWKMIRQHPVTGNNLLRGIPFLEEASKLILYHHEKYDGTGYPCGLKGEAIPMGARLIAVADAFDHMVTDRSYRKALGRKYAFMELSRCASSQFCPIAVKAFCSGFLHFHLSAK